MAGRSQTTGQWWVGTSTGTSLSTKLWDSWSPGINWVNVRKGNFV